MADETENQNDLSHKSKNRNPLSVTIRYNTKTQNMAPLEMTTDIKCDDNERVTFFFNEERDNNAKNDSRHYRGI